MTSTDTRPRITAGTGITPAPRSRDLGWIRAVASLEVVIWHSDLATKHFSSYAIQEASPYALVGGVGVQLFFVLSGYLMCLRAPSYPDGVTFLRSRILRLYPLYWLFTTAVVVAYLLNSRWHLGQFDLSIGTVLASYLILPQVDYPILGVGWTLEHEMIFYIAVAFITLRRGPLARHGRNLLPLLLAVLGTAGFIFSTEAGGRGHPGGLNGWDYHLLSPFMFTFALGWLVRLVEADGVRKQGWRLAFFLMIFVLAVTVSDPASMRMAWQIIVAGAAFCLMLSLRRHLDKDTLLNRAASTIGMISYSLYLSHWFVLSILGKLLGPLGFPSWLDGPARAASVLISIAVGFVLFLLLEQPLDRALRKRNVNAILPSPARA